MISWIISSARLQKLCLVTHTHSTPQYALKRPSLSIPKSSYLLVRLKFPTFTKAASWDSISESYNNRTSKLVTGSKPNGKGAVFYICCIWAWVLNTPNASRCGNLRIVWFCIENKRWTSVASSISFSLEHREFNSTFSVSSLTSDMPSHDSFALLPSNRSYSTDVWYDRVAIISTRGYTNIYHNA